MNEALRGKPRSVGSDLLRCFLCAGVIFHHYRPVEPGVGAFMVVGFFVLSGYLLGLSLCNRESLDVRLFYRRKSLRLLPMLIVSLALGFGFYLAHCLSTGDYSDLVAETKYGYFCWTELISHYNPPSWFVFAECYFLILLPFIFFSMKLRFGLLILTVCAAALACALHARVPDTVYMADGLYKLPAARLWQFCAGMLAAQMTCGPQSRDHSRFKTLLLLCLSAVLVAGTVILGSMDLVDELHCRVHTMAFEIPAVLLYAFLIPLLHRVPLGRSRCVSYLAILSYPIYLLHYPLLNITAACTVRLGIDWRQHHLPVVLVSLGITLLVSALLQHVQAKYIDPICGGGSGRGRSR